MGLPALIKAKHDMHPLRIPQKYTAVFTDWEITAPAPSDKAQLQQLWLESFADETPATAAFYFDHLYHPQDCRILRSHEQIIDNTNPDTLLFAGFDAQKEETADRVIRTFHEFIKENKDEIIVLRILYSQTYQDRPMAIEQLKNLYEELRSKGVTIERLWDCYAIKKPEKVKATGTFAPVADLVSIIV